MRFGRLLRYRFYRSHLVRANGHQATGFCPATRSPSRSRTAGGRLTSSEVSILARPQTRQATRGDGRRKDSARLSPDDAHCAPSALRLHPRGELVPELTSAEYESLLIDIGERGVLTPLEVTRTGRLLDGRARLRAASELGLSEVPIRIVAPDDEVRHLVLAALNRRQLSASQRAALWLELSDYEHELNAGRERQRANLKGQPDVAALPPRGERTCERNAREAGVSARTLQDAATVKAADPKLFAKIKADELSAEKAARIIRRRKLAALPPAPALPAGPFDLLYADPPWQLGNPDASYAPENYYPTLPLEEIKALEVPAAEDGCLFLWAVNSLLREALEVMEAWGFANKTNFCWDKRSIGLGVWARNRHELLLFGIRGRFSPPEPEDRCDSVIEATRGRHSEKPACVYERIERMYPQASKLELFARGKPRAGWTAWGNEVAA